MQPLEATKAKVSDDAVSKKCRLAKKKKVAKLIDSDAAKVDPVVVATTSAATRSPGPYRGKCLYQSRKCENERAVKRNGKPHNLCEEHRSKQNQHQRKFDAKKFSRKRRRDSLSDEDAKADKRSHRNEESSVKHQRTNQVAETRTPSHVTAPTSLSSIRENYYTAGSTPMSAPLTRLPPIQSPILLPSPAVLYSTSSSMVHSVAAPMVHRGQQTSRDSHQPYLQQQVSQAPAVYSHSELVAASILAQPPYSPPRVAASTVVNYREESPISGGSRAMTTPRLPSLIPRSAALSPSPYYRVSETGPSSSQRFTSAVVAPVSVAPAANVLPPLVGFGLRRSSTSPTSISKPLN
ncbi:hypothetical protein AM587_10010025 [Phytophthora nicotianae]|uniref:Mucolipin-3 n=1 Tax=Phytophthora nicotianae TaxID=4792 RepID=A0A0W8C3B1_PHYNI|nr:hypothetical protein AM587_10010025 [Phytophthora nicotianae]KUF92979.1 Mucolipin-3 [Phytophthora nicotianae]